MRNLLGVLLLCSTALCASLPVVETRRGELRTETITLRALDTQHQYSVLFSIARLRDLNNNASVRLEVAQGNSILTAKTLHAGDPDLYAHFRVPSNGPAELRIHNNADRGTYQLQINRWANSANVRTGPNHRWQDAMQIPLGQTVFASGDDVPYIPLPGTTRRATVDDPAAIAWYRFEFTNAPKLVYLLIDLMERDQVPVDVRLYRLTNGEPKEYFEGEDPVSLPHEVQALPGNKFIPRVLKQPGTYFIAVRASHPEYKLRTRVYDPPPYQDPRIAVQTAADYVIASGDSWHANTPRRGGIVDRVSSVHQETSLCVGCHVTHFPQRAQLYAVRNGYAVNYRQQLQFLTERFYNNPRPFYGFEDQGAVWARMISAPANVLGRMSHLLDLFETHVSRQRRDSFHNQVNEYLRLYYKDRDKLPGDETNGNTPLVSAHEVAWYAWTNNRDPRLPDLVARGEVKNLIDLCYQTLALAEMDRTKYAGQIEKNATRILALQRPSGQWSMRFEPEQPEVEFQTGHALWALHAAGIPATHPQVAKGLNYLLSRQQEFGGWLDPLQSFENFRTPFRETQMAVLALSAYYPREQRQPGWNTPPPARLSTEPARLLEQLDNIWDPVSPAVAQQIAAAAKSNDALIRQAAVEALGRLGMSIDTALLGDPSKMVQRTAAWAIRQHYSRAPNTPLTEITTALASTDDRTRWGASRIFATHFAALAKRDELAPALQRLASDSILSIRLAAIKALWQFWFWTPSTPIKSGIEDTLLAQLAEPQHPWIVENLRHAVYNLADENIRYLYNNWVPALGNAQDRERSIRGRLAIESRLAGKFAAILETGNAHAQKELLAALTELPLRRGDIYDLDADLTKNGPPVYNRIGNDIEQIAFFGDSADRFARALRPLLDSTDPETRTLASRAVLLVRETRFGDVNRAAGPAGQNTAEVTRAIESIPEAAEVVRALKPPPPVQVARDASGNPRAAKPKLDEPYFRGYVQPILEKRGKDGYACVHCHASHTLFNGTYGTALNVVNPAQPDKSLILLKPTSSAETEGIAGSDSVAHGGGVRFLKDSPEYVTILEWIKGAKE
jgi:hypothetical protein